MEWDLSRRTFLETGFIGLGGSGKILSQQPNSQLNARQYWEEITSQNWGYTNEKTGLEEYHDETGDRGEDRTILVIDTGFDTNHPLYNPVFDGEDFKPYHVNIYGILGGGSIHDQHQTMHGTGVTGMAWQAAPNAEFHIGYAGADFWGLEIPGVNDLLGEGRNKMVNVLREAQETSTDYDVVVTSKGLVEDDVPFWKDVDQLQQNILEETNELADSSTIFVAAAGDKEKGSTVPEIPSLANDAISVSSTNLDGISRPWSPERPKNDKPDLAAPGEGIYTLGQKTLGGLSGVSGSSGSSYSAPLVAGIALLLRNHGSAEEVKTALLETAEDIPDTRLDGEGRVSMMDAFEKLTSSNQSSSTDVEPDTSFVLVATEDEDAPTITEGPGVDKIPIGEPLVRWRWSDETGFVPDDGEKAGTGIEGGSIALDEEGHPTSVRVESFEYELSSAVYYYSPEESYCTSEHVAHSLGQKNSISVGPCE